MASNREPDDLFGEGDQFIQSMPEWLTARIIQDRRIALLPGDFVIGKSFLLLDAAIGRATGTSSWGHVVSDESDDLES